MAPSYCAPFVCPHHRPAQPYLVSGWWNALSSSSFLPWLSYGLFVAGLSCSVCLVLCTKNSSSEKDFRLVISLIFHCPLEVLTYPLSSQNASLRSCWNVSDV